MARLKNTVVRLIVAWACAHRLPMAD